MGVCSVRRGEQILASRRQGENPDAGRNGPSAGVGSTNKWKNPGVPIRITKFDSPHRGVIYTPYEFYQRSPRAPAGTFLMGLRFSPCIASRPEASLEKLKPAPGEEIGKEGSTPLGVVF